MFNRVAVITPEEAARTIVQGILRNKDRVLIGADAYRMDRLARLLPTRSAAMFTNWLEKRREKMTRALSAASN